MSKDVFFDVTIENLKPMVFQINQGERKAKNGFWWSYKIGFKHRLDVFLYVGTSRFKSGINGLRSDALILYEVKYLNGDSLKIVSEWNEIKKCYNLDAWYLDGKRGVEIIHELGLDFVEGENIKITIKSNSAGLFLKIVRRNKKKIVKIAEEKASIGFLLSKRLVGRLMYMKAQHPVIIMMYD